MVEEEKMSEKRGDPWDEIKGLPPDFKIQRIVRKATKEPSWRTTLAELRYIGDWFGLELTQMKLDVQMEFDFHLGRVLQAGRDPNEAYDMFRLIDKAVELHISIMRPVLRLLDGLTWKLEEDIIDVLQARQ